MQSLRASIVSGVSIALLWGGVARAATIYVDDDAPLGGNGESWVAPLRFLQDALLAAEAGDEIRVAGGRYQPDQDESGVVTPGARTETFELFSGIALYGGYAGYGAADPDERDVVAYEAELSGDLEGNDGPDFANYYENSYHVVVGNDTDSATVLDGFTITGGNANAEEYSDQRGGGLCCDNTSIIVANCTVTANTADSRGGGICFSNSLSPTVLNCTFLRNAARGGAGMLNEGPFPPEKTGMSTERTWGRPGTTRGEEPNGSYPTITNCAFIENSASSGGGGLLNEYSSPTLTACTFSSNAALYSGAGMSTSAPPPPPEARGQPSPRTSGAGTGGTWNYECRPILVACTFEGNSVTGSGRGGGLYALECNSVTLLNCAFRGNSAGESGGGILTNSGGVLLANCTIAGNTAASGAGICNNGGLTLTNCTINANHATLEGGGLYEDGYAVLTNCILWGNTDGYGTVEPAQIHPLRVEVNYCCVQGYSGGLEGVGNTGAHPRFVDADGPDDVPGTADDDLRLLPGSPCTDAGDNMAVPLDTWDLDHDGDTAEPMPVDFNGDPRLADDLCVPDIGRASPDFPGLPVTDMGACEHPDNSLDDTDGDGISNCFDNCPTDVNPNQADCDEDGIGDVCALAYALARDCNDNGIPDDCDIQSGFSMDDDINGIPDECRQVFFVDDDAPPGGDGATWVTALVSLQQALALAQRGDEIRLAGGFYTPAQVGGARGASFALISGVAIYGACAGLADPAHPDERDPVLYETILSGDLNRDDGPLLLEDYANCFSGYNEPLETGCEAFDYDGDGDVDYIELPLFLEANNYSDNAYHVLTAAGTESDTLLDGVTMTAGVGDQFYTADERGGGLYSPIGGSPTLVNCTFVGNSAGRGAAIYNRYSSNPTLIGCTFSKNSATGSGGAMYNYYSDPVCSNCSFERNSGASAGGMVNHNCDPTLHKCTFTANRNGGMINAGSSPTITSCVFDDHREGALINGQSTSPTIIGCSFSNNERRYGGGIYNPSWCVPTVIDCTFIGNRAEKGGGLFNGSTHWGPGQMITNCVFIDNHAYQGGGVYNRSHNTATFTNCAFFGNSASDRGGALFNFTDSSPVVIGSVFAGNSASQGGAICNYYAERPALINCTLSCNSAGATGGGVRSWFTDDTCLTNCILWGNTDYGGTDESAQIDARQGNVTTSQSCVEGWTGVLGGEGNTGVDPHFVDADGTDGVAGTEDDDLRLGAGSPCIDAGNNMAVPCDMADIDEDCDTLEPAPVDLDGKARFADDLQTLDTGIDTAPVVDMGAYEYADCNGNEIPDDEDIADCGAGDVTCADCNANGIPDGCDVSLGISADDDAVDGGDGVPDECQGHFRILRSDPPDWAIDARHPQEPDGDNPAGWDSATLVFNGEMSDWVSGDFTVTEVGGDELAPTVVGVEHVCGNTGVVQLSEPVEPVTWTIITHTPSGAALHVGYLPGDVDGSGVANANDIVEEVEGVIHGGPLHRYDTDRDGEIAANDITVLIDLLNGAGEWDPYYSVSLPPVR